MFKRYKNYSNNDRLVNVVLDNSLTTGIGYPCDFRTGVVTVAAAGSAVGGIIVDILDKQGNTVFGSTLRELGVSALTTDNPASGIIFTGAANTTTDLIVAVIDTSKEVIYSASITGTMNTTATSSTAGGWVDGVATTGLTIDETTHTRTITTGGQYKTWGVDPQDSTRMLVSINESEVWDATKALA